LPILRSTRLCLQLVV